MEHKTRIFCQIDVQGSISGPAAGHLREAGAGESRDRAGGGGGED
jgi:hypothetical protein